MRPHSAPSHKSHARIASPSRSESNLSPSGCIGNGVTDRLMAGFGKTAYRRGDRPPKSAKAPNPDVERRRNIRLAWLGSGAGAILTSRCHWHRRQWPSLTVAIRHAPTVLPTRRTAWSSRRGGRPSRHCPRCCRHLRNSSKSAGSPVCFGCPALLADRTPVDAAAGSAAAGTPLELLRCASRR